MDVVRQRRMVRRYDPGRPIDRATVDHLLDLARRAPSAGFTQGGHFLVLETEADRAAFWTEATDRGGTADGWLTGMRGAPVLILVFSDRGAYERRYRHPDKQAHPADRAAPVRTLEQRWPVPYWDIDAGMAALLILLGAVDAALAGCWFGVPTDRVDAVRRRFDVPPGLVPVGVVSLGYPLADAQSRGTPDGRGPDGGGQESAREVAESRRPRRRPRTERVSYGRYGSTGWAGSVATPGSDPS